MSREEMFTQSAKEIDCKEALNLAKMLLPGLKIKKNGRVETAYGDKTALGLYRMIKVVL